jgi:thiosulfate/3-mercaptopyruvate sulfurtransferase
MDRVVSTEWLANEIGAPDLRVLDCSVALRYLPQVSFPQPSVEIAPGRPTWEQGHIPGSQHVDLLSELSDHESPLPLMLPPPGAFAATMSGLGIGDGTRVVLHDTDMNMWAERVWWMLRAYGFDPAAGLDGGWQAWSTEGREVSTTAGCPARADFVPRPRPDVFADKAAVLAALDRPTTALVCALQPEAFTGERRDYPRNGHLPGARNVPYSALVDPHTHRYLPADQLRDVFGDFLVEHPKEVITYCGAGIAACSDALVLIELGVPKVKVYDGSMYEWSADPSLPLVSCTD